MITENGAVKTSTPITEQVSKELNKKVFILSIIYIVFGAIILALGFAFYVFTTEGESFGLILLVCGTIILLCGIIMVVNHGAVKKATLKYKKVDEVEFYRDYLMLYEYTDGELTTTSKIYYGWVLKIKETANYLFLYNTRATAVAVDKNSLPLTELNTVRMLLGRPVVAGQTPTAPSAADYVEPAAVADDPFKELSTESEAPDEKDGKK